MPIPDFRRARLRHTVATARQAHDRARRVGARLAPIPLMLGLVGCFPPPGTPVIPKPDLAGTYAGVFDSSWGSFPITATIQGQDFAVFGPFEVGPGKASGRLYGSIQNEDLFRGTFTITYVLSDGTSCTGVLQFDGGFSNSLVSSAFVIRQECPDSPTPVRINWRRTK